MSIEVKKWNEIDELSEDLLKSRYSPRSKYRVSGYDYESGSSIPGAHRKGMMFVISGSCKYTFGEHSAILHKGSYFDIQSGTYQLSVLGNKSLKIVFVWDIGEPSACHT